MPNMGATSNALLLSLTNCVAIGTLTNPGLFYSSNGGASWSLSNITTAYNEITNLGSTFIASSGLNGINVIALSISNCYYSSDYGQTWAIGSLGGIPMTISYNANGSYASMNGNYALIATSDSIIFSSDSGHNWTTSNFTGVPYSVHVDSTSGNAFATTTTGVRCSSDYGATWTTPSGITLYDCPSSIMTNGHVVFADISGGLYYSSNYGQTYALSSGGVSGSKQNSLVSDETGQNCVFFEFTLWYSSDYGVTFTDSGFSPLGMVINTMSMSGTTVTTGHMQYSTTGGSTLSFIQSVIPTMLAIIHGSSTFGVNVIVCDAETVYYSTDGGANYSYSNIGGTPVAICFLEGSKILHLNTDNNKEEYIEIEKLRKGDLVKTVADGYKKIECIGQSIMTNNVNDSGRSIDKLYKCSKNEYPELIEDLIVTGAHAILVSSFKNHQQEQTRDVLGDIYITGKFYRLPACVDNRTAIYEISGNHKIWNLSLEHTNYYFNYGIYANGLLVETASNRMMKEKSGMYLQ